MNRISFGMDDAEEKWWPNKPLDKYSPAWMWKLQRQHLAKGENRNKAGRKKGSGTTSQARRLARQNKQPQGGCGDGGGNGGDDGGDPWAKGLVLEQLLGKRLGQVGQSGMTGKMTGTGAPDKAPGKGVTAGGRGGRAEAATAVPHL